MKLIDRNLFVVGVFCWGLAFFVCAFFFDCGLCFASLFVGLCSMEGWCETYLQPQQEQGQRPGQVKLRSEATARAGAGPVPGSAGTARAGEEAKPKPGPEQSQCQVVPGQRSEP